MQSCHDYLELKSSYVDLPARLDCSKKLAIWDPRKTKKRRRGVAVCNLPYLFLFSENYRYSQEIFLKKVKGIVLVQF